MSSLILGQSIGEVLVHIFSWENVKAEGLGGFASKVAGVEGGHPAGGSGIAVTSVTIVTVTVLPRASGRGVPVVSV